MRDDLYGISPELLRTRADLPPWSVAILTAGRDRPYALGLATALLQSGVSFDFIVGDELLVPELLKNQWVRLLNLRGDQRSDVSFTTKVTRVAKYYWRLIRYAAKARPSVFHVLWNNKFELVDRVALMFYYRVLGKRIALTAHNVNIGQRDGSDSIVNRLSLRIQYRLSDHIFVHTRRMRDALMANFNVPESKISVIPFGINNTVPVTALSKNEARLRLGLRPHERVALFFGNIAPYKGLEHLITAFLSLANKAQCDRLIIAGRPKGDEEYWSRLEKIITASGLEDYFLRRIEYIPDDETEVFFKASDVLILPYTRIFQSGVLFLGYSFGLPVVATDVGSLRDDIIDGETGFLCDPADPRSLEDAIRLYFASNLFRELDRRKEDIRRFANERYSWEEVGRATREVYRRLVP